MTDRPNILLIVLDSARAENIGLYEHENSTTPYLTDFANNSATVFERSWAPSTWSLPSHTSMFTGLHVEEHNVTEENDRLDPKESVFYKLREDGYETGVFSENTWVTEMDVGLKNGFNRIETGTHLPFPNAINPTNFVLEEGQGNYMRYLKACLQDDNPIASMVNGLAVKARWDFPRLAPDWAYNRPRAEHYVKVFQEWLDETNGPWAACVNLMDPHLPYSPEKRFDNWSDKKVRRLQNEMDDSVWECHGGQRKWWQRKALESLYDGAILETDDAIRTIIEGLKQRTQFDNTLIVITSDHGEGFGEPSLITPERRIAAHGSGIHEVLLRVPLVVKEPMQTDGRVEHKLAAIRNFAPAVEAARENRDITQEFTEERVLASYAGMEEPMKERALRYVDDVEPYDSVGRAVYTANGDSVEKLASWGDTAARITVRTPKQRWRTEMISTDTVEKHFESLSDADVNDPSAGGKDIQEDVEQRLEDLGYR